MAKSKQAASGAGSSTKKASAENAAGASASMAPSPPPTPLATAGATHVPHYHDTHEDYISVSRARLREISTLGWIQEGAGGAGVFFSSGAFWLLATLVAEHWDETAKYTPWFILCGLSILFGVVLMWIGFRHFKMKQDYISDLFGDDDATPP